MKKVNSPDTVAHLFAHQSQNEATNSNRSLFFENDKIYSYGRHFCIARHVTAKDGDPALLFTTRRYSNTTAKHISIVRNATNHINKIYCNDPTATNKHNFNSFETEIENALKGLATARKPEKYIQEAEQIQGRAEKYAQFFNLITPPQIAELLESATTGKYKEYLIQEADRIQKEQEQADAKALKAFKKLLSTWRAGETERLYNRMQNLDFLRINNNGRIQTSQGVEVPAEIGKRAYNWIKNTKICNSECNYQILEFSVKELTKEFIKIGCHTIEIKEINKIAKQLNW
jgi:hypothetical protein